MKYKFNPFSNEFDFVEEHVDGLDVYLKDLGFLKKGLEIVPNSDLSFNLKAGYLRGFLESSGKIETFAFPIRFNVSFSILDAFTGNPLVVNTSSIDPSMIDGGNGNQTRLSGNNRVGLVEFYQALSGELYMLYGQKEYSSLNVAKRDYVFEQKNVPGVLDAAVRIGGFLLRRNASNLQAGTVVQVR